MPSSQTRIDGLLVPAGDEDRDAAAGGRVLERVREEVRDDLLDPDRIRVDRDGLAPERHGEIQPLEPRRLREPGHRLADDLVQVDDLAPQRDLAARHAGDLEQVVHQSREPACLPLDDPAGPLAVGRADERQREQDRAEGVPQLVAEHREELVSRVDRATQLVHEVPRDVLPPAAADGGLHRADEGEDLRGPLHERHVAERLVRR